MPEHPSHQLCSTSGCGRRTAGLSVVGVITIVHVLWYHHCGCCCSCRTYLKRKERPYELYHTLDVPFLQSVLSSLLCSFYCKGKMEWWICVQNLQISIIATTYYQQSQSADLTINHNILLNRKKLFHAVHMFVHVNLAISLLLGYLVFMLGIETATSSTVSIIMPNVVGWTQLKHMHHSPCFY